MSRSLVASLLGFALVAAVPGELSVIARAAPPAGPGDLDPTFGVGGLVTTDFAGSSDIGEAVVIQPNGRIVVGGQSCSPLPSGTCDFGLARYLSSGVLDASLGAGGKVTTDFGGNYDAGQSLALQTDGKIIVAGYTCLGGTIGCPSGSDLDFALARHNPDGSLDPTFGVGGRVTTDFSGSSDDRGYGVAIQADGHIVVAGRTCPAPGTSCFFGLARYDGSGTLDGTFGSGGLVTTDFGPGSVEWAFAVLVQPDGRIVAAGDSGSGDFGLARYLPSGSLDASFGAGGLVTTDFAGSSDSPFALTLQPDGKLVAAGRTQVPISQGVDVEFGVARYDTDGSLDSGFGSGGTVTTAFAANSFDVGRGVAVQADGKIVVAGFSARPNKDFDVVLIRYDTDGSPDKGFGKKGEVTTDFANGGDGANALAIQPDGRIVVAGQSQPLQPLAPPNFALARYLP